MRLPHATHPIRKKLRFTADLSFGPPRPKTTLLPFLFLPKNIFFPPLDKGDVRVYIVYIVYIRFSSEVPHGHYHQQRQ